MRNCLKSIIAASLVPLLVACAAQRGPWGTQDQLNGTIDEERYRAIPAFVRDEDVVCVQIAGLRSSPRWLAVDLVVVGPPAAAYRIAESLEATGFGACNWIVFRDTRGRRINARPVPEEPVPFGTVACYFPQPPRLLGQEGSRDRYVAQIYLGPARDAGEPMVVQLSADVQDEHKMFAEALGSKLIVDTSKRRMQPVIVSFTRPDGAAPGAN